MALKVVFLFALVALAYGLPATESSEKSGLDLQVPESIDSYVDKLLPITDEAPALPLEESNIEIAKGPVREKRACRTIQYRSRSGRIVSVRRC